MTYDQYWHEDVMLVVDYAEAEKLRMSRRNYEMWLQGAYVYRAIGAFSGWLGTPFWDKKHGARPTPEGYNPDLIPLTEEEAKALEEKKEAERLAESIRYFSGGRA